MKRLGIVLTVGGAVSFILPLLGVQLRFLDRLGDSRAVIAVCATIAGLVLLVAGVRKDQVGS
jgi:ABC-type cobalamin transport system permease subunit